MAGTSEILQEYLISLGFQTDAISLAKFTDGMGKVGKRVLGIGSAVAGVVTTVEAASAAFAYSMRKVYFQSELAHSSVKNLRALEFAGKQIGVSGEAITGAVHNMAQAMRLNPGMQALVESFGVRVTGRDMSDVVVDFVKALKDMPEFVGAQYAGLFGVDPDTYHQMITHMDELQAKRKQLLDQYKNMGIDPDAAKQVVLDYTSALDEMETKFSALGIAMMTRFMPQFKGLTSYLNETMDWWIGWARGINKVDVSLEDLVRTVKYAVKEMPSLQGAANWVMSKLGFGGSSTPSAVAAPPAAAQAPTAAGSPAAGGRAPRNERNNNPGNIRYGDFAKSHGATGQDSDGFAIFPSMAVGFSAMQALLGSYGSRGFTSVSQIVGRWAPKNENNTALYAATVAKRMGVSATQSLDLNDPAVMRSLVTNMARYEGLGDKSMAAYGGGQVVMQTTINVNGSGSPEATAKAIGREQTRVASDTLRNTKGRVM